MHASDIRRLAEELVGVAATVGTVQLTHFTAGVALERKADASLVTVADRESEEIILAALQRVAPGVAVIAEEEVAAGRIPSLTGPFFLVDPLDGTNGFTKGRKEFTVNIAFIENSQPVFGLVYAPALADFYVTLGPNEVANAELKPSVRVAGLADCAWRPIRTRVPDPNALSALTSHSNLNRATEQFLDRYRVVDRRAVSSSLKFGLLARGEADVYPRVAPTSEWDTAAGHAVLAAAGGEVTTLEGEPLRYGHASRAFVNPSFVAWGRRIAPRDA